MLNPKQKRFVDEYLLEPNATKAAISAGYSQDTAYSIGQRLLKHVEVNALLTAKQAKLANRYEVSQDRIIAELARIGFSTPMDFMTVNEDGLPTIDMSGIDDDTAKALAEVSIEEFMTKDGMGKRVKFKLHDKIAALNLLGKHLGMFKEQINVDVKIGLGDRLREARERAMKTIEAQALPANNGAPKRIPGGK